MGAAQSFVFLRCVNSHADGVFLTGCKVEAFRSGGEKDGKGRGACFHVAEGAARAPCAGWRRRDFRGAGSRRTGSGVGASCTHELTQTPPLGQAGTSQDSGEAGLGIQAPQGFFPFAARTASSALCAPPGLHRGGSDHLAKYAGSQRSNTEPPLEGLIVTALSPKRVGAPDSQTEERKHRTR